MRIVGTIEARMGSKRLPGKTLMPVSGDLPLLGLVVDRFKRCQSLDDVFVATTVEAGDDPIAAWCATHAVNCYRGSEDDVLDRVAQTAIAAQADAIVQMGADSGYLDFELIDRLVAIYRQGSYDYVCNDLELTWPLGIYGHVVNVPKLVALNARADLSCHDREDVVRYIFEHPEIYRLHNVPAPAEFAYPKLRFTIDYPEDMQLLKDVISEMGGHGFTTPELLELYRNKPALFDNTLNLVQMSAPFIKVNAHA